MSQTKRIETIINLGVSQYQSGDFTTAIDTYQSGLLQEPNNPFLHYNLGLVFQQIGQLEKAIVAYQKSLKLKNDNAQAHNNIGVILVQKGELASALLAFKQAVTVDTTYVEVYNNIGYVLEQTAQIEQAIVVYKKALHINADHAPTHNHLGLAYQKLGQFDFAITSFRQAIAIWPDYAGAYSNLGLSWKEKGDLEQALRCYERALQLDPNQPEAHSNKGKLLLEIGETNVALDFYDRATQFDSTNGSIRSNGLFASLHSPEITPENLAQRHRKWGEIHPPNCITQSRRPAQRGSLNIGYVSPDFRQHAWANFIQPILANHNHNRFDVFCYSQVIQADSVTGQFKSMANHWRDIFHLSDRQVADIIAEDQIDVLVDLTGHTAQNRLQMFNFKPAPIQAILGHYQSTTGLKSMDYRLTDRWIAPPESANLYDEKLAYLDYGMICYDPPASTPSIQPSPEAINGYITFCSFNRLSKINYQVIELWSQVLAALPESKLILKDRWLSQDFVRNKIYDSFCSHGISSDRLTLIPTVEKFYDHLNLYNQADIALDPFPCNGQTTSCEGLWMGVPILTLSGNRCSQRFGSSLLYRLGLDELIATDQSEYIVRAVQLAEDLEKRQFWRSNLRKAMKPKICDGATFVRQLEKSYRMMISNYIPKD